jgi:hypothetical protein
MAIKITWDYLAAYVATSICDDLRKRLQPEGTPLPIRQVLKKPDYFVLESGNPSRYVTSRAEVIDH